MKILSKIKRRTNGDELPHRGEYVEMDLFDTDRNPLEFPAAGGLGPWHGSAWGHIGTGLSYSASPSTPSREPPVMLTGISGEGDQGSTHWDIVQDENIRYTDPTNPSKAIRFRHPGVYAVTVSAIISGRLSMGVPAEGGYTEASPNGCLLGISFQRHNASYHGWDPIVGQAYPLPIPSNGHYDFSQYGSLADTGPGSSLPGGFTMLSCSTIFAPTWVTPAPEAEGPYIRATNDIRPAVRLWTDPGRDMEVDLRVWLKLDAHWLGYVNDPDTFAAWP